MRGSVGSCPDHGSWPVMLPFLSDVCGLFDPSGTRSSAVAKMPRDASCLSVPSFVASIIQYFERSFFLLLVTSASDLLVRTIRFCFVVFGVT